MGSNYRQLLEATWQEGIEQGVIRAEVDAHFMAYSVIGICNSWGAYLVRDESLDLFETIDQCADLVLNGTLNHS